ncbi:MAG: TetR/AcrR family transcriptional regulator [Clostridiales bacterium]|nr:TetR/AcrR family transcriptional regulator [Clostridiales bacterium]
MNKDEKLQLTKDKLLEATLQLMEKMEDPLQVTSREIADKAGTKPSMINYCFGSRENLIYSVFMKEYLGFLNEKKIQELISSDISPKELLKEIHFLVASCLVENYKFTKAITGYVLFKRDLGKESFSFPYVMKHFDGRKTEEECKLIAYELSTMMQIIIYRKDDIKNDFGIDLDDPAELRRFVDMRVDLLMD